jgi:hypothetical protein
LRWDEGDLGLACALVDQQLRTIREDPVYPEAAQLGPFINAIDGEHEHEESASARILDELGSKKFVTDVKGMWPQRLRVGRQSQRNALDKQCPAQIGFEMLRLADLTVIEGRDEKVRHPAAADGDPLSKQLHNRLDSGGSLQLDYEWHAPVDKIDNFLERRNPLAAPCVQPSELVKPMIRDASSAVGRALQSCVVDDQQRAVDRMDVDLNRINADIERRLHRSERVLRLAAACAAMRDAPHVSSPPTSHSA